MSSMPGRTLQRDRRLRRRRRGLGLENQGDIDLQSIAGATATATHGTGARFANLSARIVGLRLVTATGDVLTVSDAVRDRLDPDRVFLNDYNPAGARQLIVTIPIHINTITSTYRNRLCYGATGTMRKSLHSAQWGISVANSAHPRRGSGYR